MKKDEIIELLKEQIKGLRDDNNRLLGQVDALIKEVSSLKEALLQKGESLSKQQRLAKGQHIRTATSSPTCHVRRRAAEERS